MTSRKTTSVISAITGVIALFALSSWILPPAAPVGEFQDIVFNQIIRDSTIGATSQNDSLYGDCIVEGENFGAGDKLYRLVVSDTDTVIIEFLVLDTSALTLFVLTNVFDEDTQSDCPDSCFLRIDSSQNTEVAFLPGIYWLSVDGNISTGAEPFGEGSFELAIRNQDDLEDIECGQIITSQTTNRLSNFGALDYAACLTDLDTTYVSGDRAYKFVSTDTSEFVFTLNKLDNLNLELFLLFIYEDASTGEIVFLGCIERSATGGETEQITKLLNPGTYLLVVDGPEDSEGGLNEGSFELSLACPEDYLSIGCGDLVMGSTTDRVNYNTEYDTCGSGYEAGDLTYEFVLANTDDVTITLTPTEGANLDLFLLSDSLTCMAVSDTADGSTEKITLELAPGTYYIVVDGLSEGDTAVAAGPFMLEVVCASLPVELVSFQAREIEDGIKVDWVTASEIAFEGFYLQKSHSGETWDNLTWQGSKGSPTTSAQYTFVDAQPYDGANFFRLMAVDFDGSTEYSGIVQVNFKNNTSRSEFKVYPTLATDWITIEGFEDGHPIRYEIRSVLGHLLLNGRIDGNGQNIEISNLSSGLLYLTLNDGKRFKTVPIQKN